MAYITNVDIQERLGSAAFVQLADEDGDGVADAAVVDEARLAAEGRVNSYLAQRFQVPIDLAKHPELADLLAGVTLDLVELRLRERRPPVSQDARRRQAGAVDWLQKIADGRLELPSSSTLAGATTRGPLAQVSGEDRILSHDELADY